MRTAGWSSGARDEQATASSAWAPRDWHNCLVARLAAASLATIPRHALAVGAEPGTHEIAVHFLLTEIDEQDEPDSADT